MPRMELNATFCRDNISTMAMPYKWKTVRKHFLNCADCMILSVSSKSRCCGYHTSTVVPCRGSLRINVSPGLATCQQCNVFLHIHFILRAAIRPIFIHPEITLETFPSLILQLRMTFVIGHKKLIIQKVVCLHRDSYSNESVARPHNTTKYKGHLY